MNKTNTILFACILLLTAVIGWVVYTKPEHINLAPVNKQSSAQLTGDTSGVETSTTTSENQQMITTKNTVAESPYTDSYTLTDGQYGNSTVVTVANGVRTINTNALANHETGTFPGPGNPNAISAQNNTYKFPVSPTYTGVAKHSREPGVAVNGVKFEPQTAERVTCESGEEYALEAIQNVMNLGLDMNNAHVQPTGTYHYHGVPTGLVDVVDNQQNDLLHIGFARDGHLVYYSQSDAYESGYVLSSQERTGTNCTITGPGNPSITIAGTLPDGSLDSDWVYDASVGDLDECNGVKINGQYVYVVTKSFPYIGRCLKGEFEEESRPAGSSSQTAGRENQRGSGDTRPPREGPRR